MTNKNKRAPSIWQNKIFVVIHMRRTVYVIVGLVNDKPSKNYIKKWKMIWSYEINRSLPFKMCNRPKIIHNFITSGAGFYDLFAAFYIFQGFDFMRDCFYSASIIHYVYLSYTNNTKWASRQYLHPFYKYVLLIIKRAAMKVSVKRGI